MSTRQTAEQTAQAKVLRIEIDQSAITAPDFPRDAAWWRRFLPAWFVQERSWDVPKENWDLSGITVDEQSTTVIVEARDDRHAAAIMRNLHRSVLSRYLSDPTGSIRLIETPAADEPDRTSTQS